MTNINDTMTEADAKRLEMLYADITDAKRAPELCIDILVLGPVLLEELVIMRRDRTGCSGEYAQMSVLYDLGRIAGLGGPVEYGGGGFRIRPEHRRAVLEWLYDYQVSGLIRDLGRFTADNGADQ